MSYLNDKRGKKFWTVTENYHRQNYEWIIFFSLLIWCGCRMYTIYASPPAPDTTPLPYWDYVHCDSSLWSFIWYWLLTLPDTKCQKTFDTFGQNVTQIILLTPLDSVWCMCQNISMATKCGKFLILSNRKLLKKTLYG